MQVVGTHGAPPAPPIPLEVLDVELDDVLELEVELLEPPIPPIPLEVLDVELDDVVDEVLELEVEPPIPPIPPMPPIPPIPLELLDEVLELDVVPLEPPLPPVFPDELLDVDDMPPEPPIPAIPPVSPPAAPPSPAPPEEFVGGDVSSLQPTEKTAMTRASEVQGVRGVTYLAMGTSRVMAARNFLKRGFAQCYTSAGVNAIELTWRVTRCGSSRMIDVG